MKYVGENSLKKLITLIKNKLDTKVDKEDGKGLSTNDYTTAEKTKLSGIATGANKYVLPVAGSALGGVKNGGDITVDSQGQLSIPDGLIYGGEAEVDSDTAPIDADTFEGYTVDLFKLIIYPVGSIYMSISDVNPANLFGGTWEQIKGRFLLGTGLPEANIWDGWGSVTGGYDVGPGTTGGEDVHALTTAELPSIKGHLGFHGGGANGTVLSDANGVFTPQAILPQYRSAELVNGAQSLAGADLNIGGNAAHNNMPPYYAVYMWRRMA